MDLFLNCFCLKKKDPPPTKSLLPQSNQQNQPLEINLEKLNTQSGQIDNNILHYLGWIDQNTVNDKPKSDHLGNTQYVVQIGFQNMTASKMGKTSNKDLTNWASVDLNKQRTPIQKWDQATKYMSRNSKTNSPLNPNQINLNLSYPRQSVTQMQFSPFIRYKIVPYLDQRMTLDVTSVKDDSRKLKKNGLIIWDYHGGPNQLFYIRQIQPNSKIYFFMNLAKGFLLTAPNYIGEDQQVQANTLVDPNFTKKQLWRIKKIQNFYYIQSVFHPGYILDLRHERTRNGTKVIIYQKGDNVQSNQKWTIHPA